MKFQQDPYKIEGKKRIEAKKEEFIFHARKAQGTINVLIKRALFTLYL